MNKTTGRSRRFLRRPARKKKGRSVNWKRRSRNQRSQWCPMSRSTTLGELALYPDNSTIGSFDF